MLRAGDSPNDLIASKCARVEARLDTDNAKDLLSDGGWTSLGCNVHEAGNTVGQVRDVFGRVHASVAVTALPSDQKPVPFLESVNPAGRKLWGVLILVSRKLVEDGLGLLAQFLVGRLTTRRLDLLVPDEDELLDVGPVSVSQTRARQLGIVAIESRVLWRQRMGDGGLADLLAVLGVEPLYAGLVRRTDGLAVGPAAKGPTLVESEGMPLLGRRRGLRNSLEVINMTDLADLGDGREVGGGSGDKGRVGGSSRHAQDGYLLNKGWVGGSSHPYSIKEIDDARTVRRMSMAGEEHWGT